MPALRFPSAAVLLVLVPLAIADAWGNEDEPSQVQIETRVLEVESGFLKGLGIEFELGAVSQEVSKLSQGTVILPGAEVPLAELDGSMLTTRFAGGLGYDWGEHRGAQNLRTSFDFVVTGGDGGVSREIQPGGEDVAIAWEAPSGATGVNLGNTGLFANQEMDFGSLDLRLTTELDYDACDAADVTLSPGLSLVYASREQDASGSAISLFDPSINSQSRQILTDRYYGLGLHLGAEYRMTERIGIYGDAGMDLLYADSEYRSTQWNRCGNIGCNPLDDEFEVSRRDSTKGFAVGGRIEVGASWHWNRLEARAGLGLDYLSRRGEGRNAATPPPGDFDFFQTKNAIEPRFQLGVRYTF